MMVNKCNPCVSGDHEGCWSILSNAPEDNCDCYMSVPKMHETTRASLRAMGMWDQ